MRASRRTSGRACSWACSLLAIACAERAEPIVAIELAGLEAGADRALLERAAARAVEPVGLDAREARQGERRWQLAARLRSVPGAFEAALELRSLDPPADGGRLPRRRYEGLGRGPDASAALSRAGEDLALAARLELAPEAEVRRVIEDPDPARAARGVEAARERRLAGALEPLLALVRAPGAREPLMPLAIGALVSLREPRAVGPLIEAGKGRPPAALLPIIFAVAEIGGREAEAWLFTVQSGHADREVRAAAAEALAELERRRAPKGVDR